MASILAKLDQVSFKEAIPSILVRLDQVSSKEFCDKGEGCQVDNIGKNWNVVDDEVYFAQSFH